MAVDISLFVISGYLMCFILSQQQSLTSTEISDFYFRRIKRIVPTYVFVITLVLAVCSWKISPFEFKQIVEEAILSLFFYSNFPNSHKVSYFDPFYIVVPVIFFFMNYLATVNLNLKYLFIVVVSMISFHKQSSGNSDAEHMMLSARIWQFLSGFIAHFIYESKASNPSGNQKSLTADLFNYYSSPTSTAVCDIVKHSDCFISSQHINGFGFRLLGQFGRCFVFGLSFHWPIFTLHRYLNETIYAEQNEADHIVGIYLIGLSILSGYFIEKMFKWISSHVRNWLNVLLLIGILYVLALIAIIHLHSNELEISEIINSGTLSEQKLRIKTAQMLWKTRHDTRLFSRNQTIAFNKRVYYINEMCSNTTQGKHLPSTWNDFTTIEKMCYEEGTGTKNIVVIGNSHAYIGFFGVFEQFRLITKTMTLIASAAYIPVPVELQPSDRTAIQKERCLEFIRTLVRVLQTWNEEVDIIITLFGYVLMKDPPLAMNAEDEVLHTMQQFYSGISSIPKEALFISLPNIIFPVHPFHKLLKQLVANKQVDPIQTTLNEQLNYLPHIRERLKLINCDRCVHVDWLNLWCDKTGNCPAFDSRQITLFMDQHHVSSYGAMYVGDYLLRLYKNFMKTRH